VEWAEQKKRYWDTLRDKDSMCREWSVEVLFHFVRTDGRGITNASRSKLAPERTG
jgi:hypothetical protein